MRNLQASYRHAALALLGYFTLVLLKILQSLKNQNSSSDLSIRFLASLLRKNILVENTMVTLKNKKLL